MYLDLFWKWGPRDPFRRPQPRWRFLQKSDAKSVVLENFSTFSKNDLFAPGRRPALRLLHKSPAWLRISTRCTQGSWLSACLSPQAWFCRFLVQRPLRGEPRGKGLVLPTSRPAAVQFMDRFSLCKTFTERALRASRNRHRAIPCAAVFVSLTPTNLWCRTPTR